MNQKIFALLAVFSFSLTAHAKTLGVLEKNGAIIRPLYKYENKKWINVGENFNAPKTWLLAFDGKSFGEVKRAAKVVLTEPAKALVQKYAKKSFGTSFTNATEHRPFVLVSETSFADPDSWKPMPAAQLDPKLKGRIFSEYLKLYPQDSCTADQKKLPPAMVKKIRPSAEVGPLTDDYFEVSFKYTAEDIVVVNSYASKRGKILSLTTKEPFGANCTFEMTQVCSTFFIAADPAATIINLSGDPTNGCREMPVVDAGDYNEDGTSEILFKDYDYNWDGYLLFDPKTKTSIRSGESYH